MGAAVQARSLVVRRGRATVLAGLDFEIATGSVTALLGPSGSGKTTLMRSVLGVQQIASGRIDVLDHPAGTPALRRRVGYSTQSAAIYDDLTVTENVRYFAAVLGVGADEVRRVIDSVDLGDHAGRLTGRLSGGQRSRVSLAVAMLGNPAVLILDEPTTGLDPVLRDQLWALFGKLASTGVTLLVSSHVMDEAGRCDHVLLLREGSLLATGTPEDLTRRTGASSLDEAFLTLVRGR